MWGCCRETTACPINERLQQAIHVQTPRTYQEVASLSGLDVLGGWEMLQQPWLVGRSARRVG